MNYIDIVRRRRSSEPSMENSSTIVIMKLLLTPLVVARETCGIGHHYRHCAMPTLDRLDVDTMVNALLNDWLLLPAPNSDVVIDEVLFPKSLHL